MEKELTLEDLTQKLKQEIIRCLRELSLLPIGSEEYALKREELQILWDLQLEADKLALEELKSKRQSRNDLAGKIADFGAKVAQLGLFGWMGAATLELEKTGTLRSRAVPFAASFIRGFK